MLGGLNPLVERRRLFWYPEGQGTGMSWEEGLNTWAGGLHILFFSPVRRCWNHWTHDKIHGKISTASPNLVGFKLQKAQWNKVVSGAKTQNQKTKQPKKQNNNQSKTQEEENVAEDRNQ